MPSELWRAASYIALDERANGSRLLLVGTPWGGTDHFFRAAFEAGQDGDPDHASFQWRAEVNPKLDHSYLERMRDRVSPAEYAAEVLGEWSDATGALIPRDLIEAATADIEIPGLSGLRPPAKCLLGVDWGVSFDRSAAVAIARLPVANLNPGRIAKPVFGVVAVEIWPVGTPLTEVVAEVVGSPASWACISPEVSGVGAGPTQELRQRFRAKVRELHDFAALEGRSGPDTLRFNEVATTSAKKTAAYGWIRHLLEQGRLVLPRHPDLLRQLAGLRFEVGERGFVRIEADSPAQHDDAADALMLAAAPHTARRRTTCLLGRLASSPIPDAEVPATAQTTQTGGGLVVPVRPALQSVAGEEVTKAVAEARDFNPILTRARAQLAQHRAERTN